MDIEDQIYNQYVERRIREEAEYETILDELKGMGMQEDDGKKLLKDHGLRPGMKGEPVMMAMWGWFILGAIFAIPLAFCAAMGTNWLAVGMHASGWAFLILAYSWYVSIASNMDRVWGSMCLFGAFVGQGLFVIMHLDVERVYRPLVLYFFSAVLFGVGWLIDAEAISGAWKFIDYYI